MSQYTAKLKLNPCIFQEPNSCWPLHEHMEF
jgi:hypothetical protein